MPIFYFKKGGSKLTFSFPRVGKMLSKSKHYILASLMIVIIQNTDHVMITMMIGETENGYYAAAITCATIASFVFTAMTDSFRPMILLHKKENERAKMSKNSGKWRRKRDIAACLRGALLGIIGGDT